MRESQTQRRRLLTLEDGAEFDNAPDPGGNVRRMARALAEAGSDETRSPAQPAIPPAVDIPENVLDFQLLAEGLAAALPSVDDRWR